MTTLLEGARGLINPGSSSFFSVGTLVGIGVGLGRGVGGSPTISVMYNGGKRIGLVGMSVGVLERVGVGVGDGVAVGSKVGVNVAVSSGLSVGSSVGTGEGGSRVGRGISVGSTTVSGSTVGPGALGAAEWAVGGRTRLTPKTAIPTMTVPKDTKTYCF